jgi:TRAP-type uncharacterized transport system substrate-binding protein
VRSVLTVIAIVLAVATAVLGASYLALQPTVLRIAVPATNTFDQRLFQAAADMLQAQRAPVQFKFVTAATETAAFTLLDRREVDLAVLRSDMAGRGVAQTVMIMRTEAAMLMAPKGGRVKQVRDLPTRALGVVREGPSDGVLLSHLLDFYGLTRDKINPTPLTADDIEPALRTRRVEAIAVVGPVASKATADVVAQVARATRGAIQFIDVEEADAIAKRIPALEAVEIDQGAFGGRPPRPTESFTTVAFSMRLVSHNRVDKDTISELIRQLLNMRQNLNAVLAGARHMRVPDLEEDSAYIAHAGVKTFVNNEQQTFFDRYSDVIYLGLFLAGGFGSVATGLLSWAGNRQRRQIMASIARLEDIADTVQEARTIDELAAIEREIKTVLHAALARAMKGDLDAGGLAAFEMAIADARARAAIQRQVLSLSAPLPALPGPAPTSDNVETLDFGKSGGDQTARTG